MTICSFFTRANVPKILATSKQSSQELHVHAFPLVDWIKNCLE